MFIFINSYYYFNVANFINQSLKLVNLHEQQFYIYAKIYIETFILSVTEYTALFNNNNHSIICKFHPVHNSLLILQIM